jgi:hypothetical protein
MHEERSWILVGVIVAPFLAMLLSATALWRGRRFLTDGRQWLLRWNLVTGQASVAEIRFPTVVRDGAIVVGVGKYRGFPG